MPGSEPVSQSIRPALRWSRKLSAKFMKPSLAALTRLPTNGSGFFRMLFSAAPVFLTYMNAPGLTTSKTISSRLQTADRLEQVVTARAFRQLRQRQENGLADKRDDVANNGLAEIDQGIDRAEEDRLGAIPDTSEIENVLPGQRVEELGKRSLQRTS